MTEIDELIARVGELDRFFVPEDGDDTDTSLGLVDLAEVLHILKGGPSRMTHLRLEHIAGVADRTPRHAAVAEAVRDRELAGQAATAVEALNELLESGKLRDPRCADQALNVRVDDDTSEVIVEVEGVAFARFAPADYEVDGDVDVISLGLAVLNAFERFRGSRRG